MTEITQLSTTQTLPSGKRRGATANVMLIDAYKIIFKNMGTNAQTDLVLGDLAEFSGYFSVAPEGTTSDGMHRAEGRREVFARILSLVGVSSGDRELIRQAALVELAISAEEGNR